MHFTAIRDIISLGHAVNFGELKAGVIVADCALPKWTSDSSFILSVGVACSPGLFYVVAGGERQGSPVPLTKVLSICRD